MVESALAIPILIALFAACLQMLHLGLAKVVVYVAAYEAARQGTINNMNLNEARRTAEEICGVLGKGRTEVTYDGQVQRYTITHYLQPIVPIVREIKVSETFPAYVFLPGNETAPANASNRNSGGGGGGSPGPEYASRGGSHAEVGDYSASADSRTSGYSGNPAGAANYPQYASTNLQSGYGGSAPLRAPPGTYPLASLSDSNAQPHIPTDEEVILGASLDSGNDALAWDDEEYNSSDSSQAAADTGAASVPPNKGRSSNLSPHEGDSSGLRPNESGSSSAIPSSRGGEGEGDVSGAATSPQNKNLLETSAEAAAKAAGKRAGETLAFYQGVAEGYTGDSNADNAFWAGQRWANQKTEESRDRMEQRLSELDAQDQELDKATGLKKLAGKASVKSKKLGAVARNIIEEGIYDIPKAGQDLPDAWKNTKQAGREMMDGNWKAAAKAGGKAVGILANEAGRVSYVAGRLKQVANAGKLGIQAAKGAKSAIKEGAKQADKAIAKEIQKSARSTINKNTKSIRTTATKWISSDKANTVYISQGKRPPYAFNTEVKEIITGKEEKFVRVHGPNNQASSWIMRKEDIKGLSARQIKDKYALPEIPTQISEVKVPKGTKMRTGIAGPQEGWGKGGGVQYELQNEIPDTNFKLIGKIE
ncbi:MAG: TadE family protein [candidate division FCPU426 bacterium]